MSRTLDSTQALGFSAEGRTAADDLVQRLEQLHAIGASLSAERDIHRLLEAILTASKSITRADGGTLYRLTEDGTLRFEIVRTSSLKLYLGGTTGSPIPFYPIHLTDKDGKPNHSMVAAYAALTGKTVNIADAYTADGFDFTGTRNFDKKTGYRSKSFLTVPMANHEHEIIGVLQLINRKRRFDAVLAAPADVEREVVPYSRRTVELVTALAGQAAVAIENSRLYEDIERLFEGFVKAAVLAIEQRDPTTFGHSGRVAGMTVNLAAVVDRAPDGPYRSIRFTREQLRELRYAGLLHDFGKVGVREQVLVKAKKLYGPSLELIRQRYAFLRRTAEREFWRQRAEFLEQSGRQGYETFLRELEATHAAELAELERFVQVVEKSNEPTVLPEGQFEELVELGQREYEDIAGAKQPFLGPEELRFLTIRKGSLDEAERQEIESHVTHTYNFLQKIPWTRELQQVPLIAFGHHEKLDGRGYPRRVAGEAIPIQTRMMTIADIFDALTAQDRPYKRAVPLDRALDIMTQEVQGGQLDQELFRLFVAAKAFEVTPSEHQ